MTMSVQPVRETGKHSWVGSSHILSSARSSRSIRNKAGRENEMSWRKPAREGVTLGGVLNRNEPSAWLTEIRSTWSTAECLACNHRRLRQADLRGTMSDQEWAVDVISGVLEECAPNEPRTYVGEMVSEYLEFGQGVPERRPQAMGPIESALLANVLVPIVVSLLKSGGNLGAAWVKEQLAQRKAPNPPEHERIAQAVLVHVNRTRQ
jgi:hypothetical protein